LGAIALRVRASFAFRRIKCLRHGRTGSLDKVHSTWFHKRKKKEKKILSKLDREISIASVATRRFSARDSTDLRIANGRIKLNSQGLLCGIDPRSFARSISHVDYNVNRISKNGTESRTRARGHPRKTHNAYNTQIPLTIIAEAQRATDIARARARAGHIDASMT